MLSEEQRTEIMKAWNDKLADMKESGKWHNPGKIQPDCGDDNVLFELGLPRHKIAIDSNLTVERANAAQEAEWRVIWVDVNSVELDFLMSDIKNALPLTLRVTEWGIPSNWDHNL